MEHNLKTHSFRILILIILFCILSLFAVSCNKNTEVSDTPTSDTPIYTEHQVVAVVLARHSGDCPKFKGDTTLGNIPQGLKYASSDDPSVIVDYQGDGLWSALVKCDDTILGSYWFSEKTGNLTRK
jgi:hypothetical protein